MAKDREVSQRHTRSTRRRTDLPALLFDLDGTLIDSVYEHVTSWADALKSAGIIIPQWKIHRRVGMSGKSFLQELFREGREPDDTGRLSGRSRFGMVGIRVDAVTKAGIRHFDLRACLIHGEGGKAPEFPPRRLALVRQAVVEVEGLLAGGLDAQGQARHLGVVVLDQPAGVRLERVQRPLGKREVTVQGVARGGVRPCPRIPRLLLI